MTGFVYLLHFDRPYKHAAHYMGWALDVEVRVKQHRAGKGAKLMRVIKDAGIGFELARTWPGDRKLEYRLKRQRQARKLCPICQ